ncbi:MAG: hypothetical protein F6K47_15005, partial [Symploca sp. SIO2E6]|nr:hypothetical protein [Symploca sp. SIO2E6]
DVTTSGDQNYGDAVRIDSNLTLSSTGDGDLNFQNTVDSTTGETNDLTVTTGNGNVSFDGAIGSNQPLGNLEVNTNGITRFGSTVNTASLATDMGGTTELNGDVTTNGAAGQSYMDAVTINGDVTLTGDELNFAANVSGTGNLSLQPFTVNQNIQIGGTDSGDTSILDLTGAEIGLLQDGFASITIGRDNGSGAVTINNAGAGFTDPLKIQSPNGSINVNGTIAGTDDASVTLDGDTVVLNAGITTENQFIEINGATTIGNNATVNTGGGDGDITFNDTVDGPANLDAIAGKGTINFNGSVGSNTPLGNLTLTADEINFAANVSGTGNLRLQPFTQDQDIQIGGTDSGETSILDLTETEVGFLQDGFTSITIGNADNTGKVTLSQTVTDDGITPFQDPVEIAGGSELEGPNRDTTWNITGFNEGNLSGFSNGLTFANIENLTGGDADDTFVFSDGAGVEGIINGSPGFDTLNYLAYTTTVDFDLVANTATGTGGILSIEDVILPAQDLPDPLPPEPKPNPFSPDDPQPNLPSQDDSPIIQLPQDPPITASSPDTDPAADDEEEQPPEEEVAEKLPLSCNLSEVNLALEGLLRANEAIATGETANPQLKLSNRISLQSLTAEEVVNMGNQSISAGFGANQQQLLVRFEPNCNLVAGN